MPEDFVFNGILNNLLWNVIIVFNNVKAEAGNDFLNYFNGIKRPGSFKKAFSSIKFKN